MNYSLNFKILLLALALLLILVVLTIKAVMIRQRRVTWLEGLNRQVVPLTIEDLAGTPESGAPRRTSSSVLEGRSAPEASPPAPAPSMEKDTQRRDEMARERAKLERILDSLPAAGRMGRSYFMRLGREMELCCREIGSPDLGLRHKGELICYRLVRQMVADRGSGGSAAMDTMDRYGAAFIKEIQGICLRQRFQASTGRSEFIRWAAAAMEGAESPVLIFLIRLLGIVGDRDSVKALPRYGRSWEPEIRRAAVWAMGMQGSPEVIDETGKILADRSLPAEEGEAFLVALERIGGRRAAGVLREVVRDARPLLAYEAYLSLRKLRGQPGRVLSLEEFEQGRTIIYEEVSAWQRAQDAQDK
jgi:hypothetical protein